MSIASEITRLQGAKSDIKSAIEAKGVTVSSSLKLDEYASKINAIPTPIEEAPENDVNFYDYDGKRIASYTIAEAKALTALPTPPTHQGLTFQEWNWSLADIQGYNRQYIDIGANYVATDGKTHLFIFTDEPNELFSFQLQVRDLTDGAVVDWGDGSATETVARYASKNMEHTYATKGYHEITIFSDQLVTNEGYKLLFNYYNQTNAWNYMVREIWLAANAFMSTLCNIDSIVTFPSNFYFNNNTFSSGTIIPVIVVHKNFVSASTNLFYQNCSKFSFPQKTTTLTNTRTVQPLFDYGRIVLPEVTDGNTTYYSASANTNIVSIPMSFKATGAAVLNGAIVSYIDIVDGWVPNISLTLSASRYWSPANLVRFFTKLGTTQTAITLTFGSTNLDKLTADEKAIATGKGYTLA